MTQVAPGAEADFLVQHEAACLAMLKAGHAYRLRCLNGGSETRRGDAADIIASYEALGIQAKRIGGFAVRIGNVP